MPITTPQTLESRAAWVVDAQEREGATLRVRGRVPAGLAVFAGHFPGAPVLPGCVQLHAVAELAREALGVEDAWTGIEALKFRSPLLPGDAFDLRIDARRPLRFVLRRGDAVISEGRLARGGHVAQHAAQAVPAPPSPLPLRIPQEPPSRLVSAVLSHAGGATLCRAEISEAHPLVDAGRAPVWLALELLAQGMAAQGGVARGDAASERAFVVGARRIDLCTGGFRASETLWVRVDHARGESGFVVCDCALGCGEPPEGREQAVARALARGRLTAFASPARPGAPSATPSPNPPERGSLR